MVDRCITQFRQQRLPTTLSDLTADNRLWIIKITKAADSAMVAILNQFRFCASDALSATAEPFLVLLF